MKFTDDGKYFFNYSLKTVAGTQTDLIIGNNKLDTITSIIQLLGKYTLGITMFNIKIVIFGVDQ